MFRRIFVIALGICLLGQGCIPILPQSATSTAPSPDGQPSPDGFVAFREGFGKLPGEPVNTDQPAARIVLSTEIPQLPEEVTVLREWDSAPSDTVLRNLTTALRVPAGALGEAPQGEGLTVRWKDGSNFMWTYDAALQTLLFEREGVNPFLEPQIENTDRAIETARAFLTERGADLRGAGDADPRPTEIVFAAARDRLPVLDRKGNIVLAASVRTDSSGASVLRGRFVLPPAGLDRSNYAALLPGEVLQRLRAGGTNPMKDVTATITFDTMTFAYLYETAMIDGHPRTFYIPALLARGTLRNGTRSENYATMVPLVTDRVFAE